jgi:hypothetical protein
MPDLLPLPISLLSFTASKLTPYTTGLIWKVSYVQGIAGFAIERSTGRNNFTKIGQVQAASSPVEKVFSFTDKEFPPGTCYYRLKIINVDNQSTYSNTVVVKADVNNRLLEIFPNPATSTLQINTSQKGILYVSVTDASGRLIRRLQLTVNGSRTSLPINVSNLDNGSYILNIKGRDGAQSASFIKK